ncbi:MAG: FAD-binding protein, partial [Actinobacteria bacterium]|nr:FAD-binding protein [Actinomycetota bacterium]
HNCIDGTDLTDSPIKNDPFLWVNQAGERFANEDMEYAMICNNVREQPGDVFYIVFDKNYDAQRAAFWNPKAAATDPAAFAKAIELGYIVEGQTLEEAAKGFEIPAEVITTTVKRYNELAANGKYEDFGKPAADLAPIKDAPFYIVRSYTPMDVTMGGLMINTKMQVLDENDEVISGLYAAGNTSGGFYGGTDYDLEVDAYSLGRAATTGRLAGEYAATLD